MKAHFYEQRLNELRGNDFVNKAIPLFDLIRNLKTNQFDHYRSYKTSAETFDSEYFHKKERHNEIRKSMEECEKQIQEMIKQNMQGEQLESRERELEKLNKKLIEIDRLPLTGQHKTKRYKRRIILYSVIIKIEAV